MHARDCTVVVMNPKTGDILAMAQWPTVSQADIQSGRASVSQATDLPVQDVFDPAPRPRSSPPPRRWSTAG